jgi:uncharacterized protein (DUF1778 family)
MSNEDWAMIGQAARFTVAGSDDEENVSEFIRDAALARAKRVLKKNSGGRGS